MARVKTYTTPKATLKIPTSEQLELLADEQHKEIKQHNEPTESTISDEVVVKIEAEKILKAWSDFALKKKENIQEYAVLNRDIIWDEHSATLILQLDNDLQQSSFNKLKPELTQYFKELYGLKSLKTEIEIVEKEDTSPKLYTSRDKYEHLTKQNPLLIDFVKRLGLELE